MRLIGLAVALAVSLALTPLAAEAQQAGRTATIGYLGNSSPTLESNLVSCFKRFFTMRSTEARRISARFPGNRFAASCKGISETGH